MLCMFSFDLLLLPSFSFDHSWFPDGQGFKFIFGLCDS